MKPVFAYLRQQGISSFYYIDDSLIEANSFDSCKSNAQFLVKLLNDLGFSVNMEKSVLTPSTRIRYLGHIIDSVQFKVYLPDEKIEKIISKCESVLRNRKIHSIREVAKLIGLLTSSLNAINLGALHLRYLDSDKVRALAISNNDYEGHILLSEESIAEILWWKNNIKEKKGKWIRYPRIDVYLETDACNAGWGANLKGVHTSGRWSENESPLHINVLEILAVKFALQSLCHKMSNNHICIRSDNSSAVSYINNQGGSICNIFT